LCCHGSPASGGDRQRLAAHSIGETYRDFSASCSWRCRGFWVAILIVLALLFWFGYRAPLAGASLFADPGA